MSPEVFKALCIVRNVTFKRHVSIFCSVRQQKYQHFSSATCSTLSLSERQIEVYSLKIMTRVKGFVSKSAAISEVLQQVNEKRFLDRLLSFTRKSTRRGELVKTSEVNKEVEIDRRGEVGHSPVGTQQQRPSEALKYGRQWHTDDSLRSPRRARFPQQD